MTYGEESKHDSLGKQLTSCISSQVIFEPRISACVTAVRNLNKNSSFTIALVRIAW